MKSEVRKITKEQYDRAMEHNGWVTNKDVEEIFPVGLLMGYGVYLPRAFEENGEYFVSYELGNGCD